MNYIEFVYCNKIYILEKNNNTLTLTEKDSRKVIKLTEEHQNIDAPLLELTKLVSKLI